MESNYSNRDFEQYVKQNADQYRMFPSEKVWKGIHNTLHTRRRWYGLGLAFLLLLTGGAVTWVMTAYPISRKQPLFIEKTSAATSQDPASSPIASQKIEDILPFTGSSNSRSAFPTSPLIDQESLASGFSLTQTETERVEAEMHRQVSMAAPTGVLSLLRNTPVSESFASAARTRNTSLSTEETLGDPAATPPLGEKTEKIVLLNRDINLIETGHPATAAAGTRRTSGTNRVRKLSWELFVTPTISYRKLSANENNDGPSAFPFANFSNDVNKAVTHKPDIGFQIGVSARYPVAKNLKLLGGLQFNVNRYDIKAVAFNGELATINLDGGAGNTISAWTNYRNYNGYRSDWLKNFYFSVSVPIGAELKVFGNKKTFVGVAGTIQPTYIISDRAYLISTDYKNYAKVPWLIRHVNMSSGFEAFVNYGKGKTRWQIGPQVRYQLLSSFENKYPIKENLFDFGLKLGMFLNN